MINFTGLVNEYFTSAKKKVDIPLLKFQQKDT